MYRAALTKHTASLSRVCKRQQLHNSAFLMFKLQEHRADADGKAREQAGRETVPNGTNQTTWMCVQTESTQKISRTEFLHGRQRVKPGSDWWWEEQTCALSLGFEWLWWWETPCQQQQMREQGVLEMSGTPAPTYTALCEVGKGLFVTEKRGSSFTCTEQTMLEPWKDWKPSSFHSLV